MFSDVSGFAISIFSVTLSTLPKSKVMTFGYHRAEIIGALTSILLIWGLTVVLMIEAYKRIITPPVVDAKIMFGVAIIGLIVNLTMMKVLNTTESEEKEEEENEVTY